MPRVRQRITLADGRRLGYDEHGLTDGAPVVYLHGAPGARNEWSAFVSEDLAVQKEARVITVDRPGVGLSDFQPGRKVLDWPADVAALADALELNRFAVLGFSGGCPFALACAFRLPERVTALGIVSGVVPDDLLGPGAAQDPKIVQSQYLSKDRPRMARVVFTSLGLVSWFMPPMIVKQALAVFLPPDQDLLRRADFQPRFIAMFREAHRQGARGSVLDQALMVSPWGFDPHQIAVPTHIWVGEDDQHAPPVMARYLAEAIPSADLHVMPGVGHMSVFYKHAPDILKTLVAQP